MALAVQRKRILQRCGRIVQTFAQRIQVVENEVHQAMAVRDKITGKMLNYSQLMRHPIYKKDWQLSSANEFGRLANGVGGRIKGTNTIKFICMQDVKKGRMKDVTYGQFYVSFDQRRLSQIEHALLLAAIALITQAR